MKSTDAILIMVPPSEPKMPPLGLAYIAEYLRSSDLTPKVIDFNIDLYHAADISKRIFWDIHNINSMGIGEITDRMFKLFRNEIDTLVTEIVSFDTNIIGLSVNLTSLGLAGRIATLIKKRDRQKIIVIGGTGCFWETDRRFLLAEDIPNIDIFVIGEGEEVLKNILLRGPEDLDEIEGVVYKKEEFFRPAIPYYTADLNHLPFPTFSDFDLDKYKDILLPMLTSRGCIGRCSFCIDHLMCGRYRFRSAKAIIRELEYHAVINKRKNFAFNDLICNGNLKHLEMVCDSIIQAKLDITWGSYAMIRKGMSFELLKKMKEAGCRWLCYGVESASDFVLKRMNKYYNSSDAERVIRSTYEAGIDTAVNIIVGFPGETTVDFDKTIEFIERNKGYISELTNISLFAMMPNSKLGLYPEDYGLKLPAGGESVFYYTDNNGTNFDERIRRVRRCLFVSQDLGIKNVILNQVNPRREHSKDHIVLLSIPPGRVDLPSRHIAEVASFFQSKKNNPIIYDLSIKLYNAVDDKTRKLWSSCNWYLWNEMTNISSISGLLAEKLFELMDEIICLPYNIFYFSVNKENFAFSAKIAAIFRKWSPSIHIIFGGAILKHMEGVDLIPEGIVNIFLSEAPVDRKAFTHAPMPGAGFTVDFDGFNLQEYENLRLPLLWDRKSDGLIIS